VTASIVLDIVRFAGVTTIAKMSTVAAKRYAASAVFGLKVALRKDAQFNEADVAGEGRPE